MIGRAATGNNIPRTTAAQPKQRRYSPVCTRRKKPPLMRPMLNVECGCVGVSGGGGGSEEM